MDGSNGKSVALLERIADRLDSMQSSIDALRTETRAGFTAVNGRMDNLVSFLGRHHADHEERIRVLEERVLGKPAGQ